ncbi:hypothetical protein Q4I28_004226 [Leishmania naiffi]|uniref:Uncharacterized protein n=1 Tax=Leishmania naiffi TaxID=5678 RepID=A0AAW3BP64_9TRYP
MLSPCAYRAALLDLLTSPAAEPQGMKNDRVRMQVNHMHADLAQARHPYDPSLRLTHRSTPSFMEQEEERVVDNTMPATSTAAAAAPPAPSFPLIAFANGTPRLASHRVIEDSVLRPGEPQVRVHSASSHGRTTVHKSVIDQPSVDVTVVEEEKHRSLILSFIDNCICTGVPDAVIAEQVQFMVSSMKESLALHAALHARQHKDRIREYELNELTAVLERQQLQFAQQQQQQQQVAPPVLVSAPSLYSSSRVLAPPPPLSYAPPQHHERMGHLTAQRTVGAKPFHYTSISQGLSSDAWSTSATTHQSGQHNADNWRPLPSSQRMQSQAEPNVRASAGGSPVIPVSSWRPRTSTHASATETPTASVARPTKDSSSDADAASSSTGHAYAQPRTWSPLSRPTSASRRSPHARGTSCRHYHRRHSRHHKLCSACNSTSSSSSRPSATFTAHAAVVADYPVDERSAGQRRSAAAKWRQQYTPSQHYMKPTHTSLVRLESKSLPLSPLRNTSPVAAHSVRGGGHVKPATLRWRSSGHSPLARPGAASEVVGRRASLQKLLVRSTHSSRLRAAAASRRQTASSRSGSTASCVDEDGNGEKSNEFDVSATAASVPVLRCRESVDRRGDSDTPQAQPSIATSGSAVTDASFRATLARMRNSVVRVDPWSKTPPPPHSPSAWGANTSRIHAGLSIDPETPLNTTGSTCSNRAGEVGMTANGTVLADTASTRGGSEKLSGCSRAASSSKPASAPTAQRSAPSQSAQEATEERQPQHRHYQSDQEHRPRRPPPQPQPQPWLNFRDAGTVSNLPASSVSTVDDDCSDANVCVTSPELQFFMERSQRKLRETERVLAQAPTPSHLVSSSHLCQSPSPISIVNASYSRTLRHSTDMSSHAPSSSGDGQQTLLLAKDGPDRSLDTSRARQRQQRLTELHRRLSSYDTASNNISPKNPRSLAGKVSRESLSAALVTEVPHEDQQSSSVIFQPHYALPVSLENSPLVQISPTSSDEQKDERDDATATAAVATPM